MNYLISENSFNPKTVEIVEGVKLKTKFYLERLEVLKFLYDEYHYIEIRDIIGSISDFSKKYLEQNQCASIGRKNFSKEEKILKQNNEFIKETVQYYIIENKSIYQDIKKISNDFNDEIRHTILSLYHLEEASRLLLEDICREINFEEEISISKMLSVIG